MFLTVHTRENDIKCKSCILPVEHKVTLGSQKGHVNVALNNEQCISKLFVMDAI